MIANRRPFEPLESLSSKSSSKVKDITPPQDYKYVQESIRKIGFDRLMFDRLGRILSIIFRNQTEPKARSMGLAWGIYLGLIAVACGYQAAAYYIGIFIPQFYTVFLEKDLSGFQTLILSLLGLIIAASAAKGLTSFLGGYFAWVSRKALVSHIHSHYVKEGSLYETVGREKDRIDNPDQRVTQDVDKFTLSVRA